MKLFTNKPNLHVSIPKALSHLGTRRFNSGMNAINAWNANQSAINAYNASVQKPPSTSTNQ